MLNLNEADRQRIQDIADYMSQLLLLDIPEVCYFIQLIGEERSYQEGCRWFLISKCMQAALSNSSDPLQNVQLDEELKNQIRADSDYYLRLGLLILKAEPYIKLEAQKKGIEYPFSDPCELLRVLITEECIDRLQSRVLTNEWESPSGTQFRSIARDSKKWLAGDIKSSLFLTKLEKWAEEDKKNLNGNLFMPKPAYLNGVRWSDLCSQVFWKYQEHLHDFFNYSDSLMGRLFVRLPFAKKFASINGSIQEYPGRGKSKKNE